MRPWPTAALAAELRHDEDLLDEAMASEHGPVTLVAQLAPVAVQLAGDSGDAGADGPSPSAPATNLEEACPTGTKSNDGSKTKGSDSSSPIDTSSTPTGSVNPPTTTSETTTPTTSDLAKRLAFLKAELPDVAAKVKTRWPYPGVKVHDLDSRQVLVVRLLVDRIIQGR